MCVCVYEYKLTTVVCEACSSVCDTHTHIHTHSLTHQKYLAGESTDTPTSNEIAATPTSFRPCEFVLSFGDAGAFYRDSFSSEVGALKMFLKRTREGE